MAKISAVQAREILDSRGNPTIETTIWSDDGHGAVASIPSGASTGKFEVVELRDKDPARFNGKGVLKAINNVNQIISKVIIGRDPTYQNKIDQDLISLDGTSDKSKLGANAILSVSQAVCELGALVCGMQTFEYLAAKYQLASPTAFTLPTPIFNVVNGGKHGAGNLDFQEFHIIPSSKLEFSRSLEIGEEIYQQLKDLLIEKKAISSVGDEGGFAPNLYSNQDALELMLEAVHRRQLVLNQDVFLGLDVAADSFYKGGKYDIADRQDPYSADEFIEYFEKLKQNYTVFSLEDPLEQEAWGDWVKLTEKIGRDTIIVGDDLLVTNKKRLQKAIKLKACNAILIKPNQIGTISETASVVKLAKRAGFLTIASHRSGDTNEDFIADFAVGVGTDFAKFGAPVRGERVVKYNRLSFIESYLKAKQNINVPKFK